LPEQRDVPNPQILRKAEPAAPRRIRIVSLPARFFRRPSAMTWTKKQAQRVAVSIPLVRPQLWTTLLQAGDEFDPSLLRSHQVAQPNDHLKQVAGDQGGERPPALTSQAHFLGLSSNAKLSGWPSSITVLNSFGRPLSAVPKQILRIPPSANR
jgi:hypothetical protein